MSTGPAFQFLQLKHAEALGARIIQSVRTREVIFDDGRAAGARLDRGRRTVDLPARAAADTTGRASRIGAQPPLKRPDRTSIPFALHAWVEGVDRGERPSGIRIHILNARRGSARRIPIWPSVTSLGAAPERSAAAGGEAWFDGLVPGIPRHA